MNDAKKTTTAITHVNYGMVGGGEGSFISDVHRKSAMFDDKCKLMAGCFSRDYQNTLKTGEKLEISKSRLYETYTQMARVESQREDGIKLVSIVTPNSSHYEIAKTFLEAGINVLMEKPLCLEIEQAEELYKLVLKKDLLFFTAYTYSGYPMVEEAKQIVRSGQIGEVRTVMGEYPQGWLADLLENDNEDRHVLWRTNPQIAGISNCIGDIGTHIENIVSAITGLKIKSLCARLENIPSTRPLDTNAHVMVTYDNDASGCYWSSQIAIGHENALRIRIYGTKGSIEWIQETPNRLKVCILGEPVRIYTRGQDYLSDTAKQLTRLPGGHPEGYYEAFANIYSKAADAVLKRLRGEVLTDDDLWFAGITDGLNGVRFIHKCVESSRRGSIWLNMEA